MAIVGITGGIGSGKSVVSRFLRSAGYAVYDSDAEAKALMNSDAALRSRLSELFGADIYNGDGLDRRLLASKVFADSAALARLNAAVHPAVRRHFGEWAQARSQSTLLFMESAILVESGFVDLVDAVWLVVAPEATRISRIVRRDACTSQEAQRRIRAQWSDDKKIPYAGSIIVNDDCMPLIPQILTALQDNR